MRTYTYLIALAGILFLASCDKDKTSSNGDAVPVIDSLTTNFAIMEFGSTKPAVLNCYATGGDLTYIWDVDLGDLFIINESGSQAQYSASPCCVGEKIISCTVSNNKGEVTESIIITITE
jgi:hypothetical protein